MGKTEIEILSELARFGQSTTVKTEKRRMAALDKLMAERLVHEVEVNSDHAPYVVMVKFGATGWVKV